MSILYQRIAKVYVAARSQGTALGAFEDLRREHPSSTGELIYLALHLEDLTTIKATAQEFLARESRLDVLWNNAGVMLPPDGSKTKQGYELQLGVNALAHLLLTELLRPALAGAAQTAPQNSVRVVWVASGAADQAPCPPIDFGNMDYHRDESAWTKYCRSKAGEALLAVECSRRYGGDGIISLVRLSLMG